MRKPLFIAIMVTLMAVSPALARKAEAPPAFDGSIKVLVLDEKFRNIPSEDEKLELLGRLAGDLMVGFSDYMGVIEVWRGKNGLYLVNELPLEDYVAGVVVAETAPDWDMEALKAQAVIVRTYVLRQLKGRLEKRYHVTSSVLHQVYKGLNSNPGVASAVRETEGQVLTYAGEPIMAFYHSTGGGRTELPEEVFGQKLPYLPSVEAESKLSPMSVWARRIPFADIGKAAGVEGLTGVKVASHTATGRVEELAFASGSGETIVKAADLRKTLGWRRLPSTNFTVEAEDGFVLFEGSGYGHGVGLSQWTALDMARDGMAYEEILSHFYPDTELQRRESIGF